MKMLRFSASMIGLLLAKAASVFAADNTGGDAPITSENSVQDHAIPGGMDVIARGDTFVIQGDFPEFPVERPEVTKALENHLIPPPQIFVPPTTVQTYPD